MYFSADRKTITIGMAVNTDVAENTGQSVANCDDIVRLLMPIATVHLLPDVITDWANIYSAYGPMKLIKPTT